MKTSLQSLVCVFIVNICLWPSVLIAEEPDRSVAALQQYPELMRVLESRNIKAVYQVEHLGITLPADETFKLGTNSTYHFGEELLAEISALIAQYGFTAVEVRAYSDDRGNDKFNQQITSKQADRISHLLSQSGIDPDRIESKGYGEANPVADNATSAGRKLNRRLELRLYPYDRSYVVSK